MTIALCFALLLCSFALPASAVGLDYNDYITNIAVDGDNDLVTVTLPVNANTEYMLYVDGVLTYDTVSTSVVWNFEYGKNYSLRIQPVANDTILLTEIPNGTKVTLDYDFSTDAKNYNLPTVYTYVYYGSSSGFLTYQSNNHGKIEIAQATPLSFALNYPNNADLFSLEVAFNNFSLMENYNGSVPNFTFNLKSFTLQFTISSLYRLQLQTGKTNLILSEVEKQLADQGKTLDEVLQQQQQTNDKLDGIQGGIDDTNDKLEALPGQIGDEMQGIIDNEKDEAKGEGNKFVDQILDALPDPSTDVLAALKGLTDVTAYTGTDAVLPIPAIVLPGVDGLFPETVIWGGTQFDFGEYIGMLPPALLVLVQSLFTIAIVIFCVYELKGIISYCLTLRESKGG